MAVVVYKIFRMVFIPIAFAGMISLSMLSPGMTVCCGLHWQQRMMLPWKIRHFGRIIQGTVCGKYIHCIIIMRYLNVKFYLSILI